MKQSKHFYITLTIAALSGGLTIYCSYDKNIVGAVINLLCVAVNVWLLKTLHSSSGSGGNWVESIKSVLTMRMDNFSDMLQSQYKYSMGLHDLANKRLSNLEHKYNELEGRMTSHEVMPVVVNAAMMERLDVKEELSKLAEEREKLRDGI